MRLSSCDVTPSNIIGKWVPHEQKGLRKALVGPVLAVSLLLCMSGLIRQSFHLVGCPFSSIEHSQDRWLLTESYLLKALTEWVWLESWLCTEDSCKGICVNFGN